MVFSTNRFSRFGFSGLFLAVLGLQLFFSMGWFAKTDFQATLLKERLIEIADGEDKKNEKIQDLNGQNSNFRKQLERLQHDLNIQTKESDLLQRNLDLKTKESDERYEELLDLSHQRALTQKRVLSFSDELKKLKQRRLDLLEANGQPDAWLVKKLERRKEIVRLSPEISKREEAIDDWQINLMHIDNTILKLLNQSGGTRKRGF